MQALPSILFPLLLLSLPGERHGAEVSSRASTHETIMNEPNPPIWPDSVNIFRPSDSQEKILNASKKTEDTWKGSEDGISPGTFRSDYHFSNRRHALLFAPGIYKGLDIQVGYYSQLIGLGESPDDVVFQDCEHGPFVPALNKDIHDGHGTCLDTFWRSAENFAVRPNKHALWAVSQAAPLRRVHVMGDLHLYDGDAYASGGHLANSKVDGHIYAGGQQQFLVRNVDMVGGASGGAWSMVYVGCTGDVPTISSANDEACVTTVKSTPTRMEKPYIVMNKDMETFSLKVPTVLSDDMKSVGPDFVGEQEETRDFAGVRLVLPGQLVSTIQEALDDGKDLVFSPGVYKLQDSLRITHPNQVIIGIGLATLEAPPNGTPCIMVSPGVPGVKIAGLMLEASANEASEEQMNHTLLRWGEYGLRDPGSKEQPGGLFDIFCRVGGAGFGNRKDISVNTIMEIHSSNIIGDNLWLWRADHAQLLSNEIANYPHISTLYWQSEQTEFRAETGITVTGDDVTIYGLAVEHANGHQTVWKGERGSVFFYQCEFPYGVLSDFGKREFRGYLIDSDVFQHQVVAPGIYSNFRNDEVVVSTAIEHPERSGIKVINPFTVKLDNLGGVASVVNGLGPSAFKQGSPTRFKTHS